MTRYLGAAVLFSTLAAPPASADLFVADTTGKVVSAPLVQLLGGRLFVQWDLDSCAFAESLLGTTAMPLRALAEYSFTQTETPSATEFATFHIDFSGTGKLLDPDGMGTKLQFNPDFAITVTIDLSLAPHYMLDTSFTAEQFVSAEANGDKEARPMKDGPNRDKAMTFDRVHAEDDGSGIMPTGHPVKWGIKFGHRVFQNGVELMDQAGGWSADSDGNLDTSGFVMMGDVIFSNPAPGETDFTFMSSNMFDVALNLERETISFENTLRANLRVDCIGCIPEPSSLTLLGVGSLISSARLRLASTAGRRGG